MNGFDARLGLAALVVALGTWTPIAFGGEAAEARQTTMPTLGMSKPGALMASAAAKRSAIGRTQPAVNHSAPYTRLLGPASKKAPVRLAQENPSPSQASGKQRTSAQLVVRGRRYIAGNSPAAPYYSGNSYGRTTFMAGPPPGGVTVYRPYTYSYQPWTTGWGGYPYYTAYNPGFGGYYAPYYGPYYAPYYTTGYRGYYVGW